MNYNEYLSDEELQKLIDMVEQEEQLEAPAYLKMEVMDQIGAGKEDNVIYLEESKKTIKEDSKKQKKLQNTKKRMSLMWYTLRVSAAATAAIIMLFLFPMYQRGGTEHLARRGDQVAVGLNEKSNQFSDNLAKISDLLIKNQ